MKIVYINGYKGENSSKPQKLQEIFKDDEIYHCKLKYNDKFYVDECIDYIKKIEPDILVASSTGALIAEQFDIPKVLINPVIVKEDLERLFNLNVKGLSNTKIYAPRIVLIGKNDELLDWRKSYEFYKDKAEIVLTDDTHRISDIEKIAKMIKDMKEFLDRMTFILD